MLQKRLLSALSLLLVACTETPVAPTRMDIQFTADVKPSKALAATIDSDVEAAIADEQMIGLGVAVVYNKHLVFARGYGFADLDKKLSVGSATRFKAAPLWEPVNAVLALALAEAGHTAVAPDDRTTDETLAGQFVFKPGGMKNTQIDDELKPVDKAVGYDRSQAGVVFRAAALDHSPTSTGERLVSTPSDFAHFAIALMEGKLISPEGRDRMWTAQKGSDGAPTHDGPGWVLGSWKELLTVSRGGTQEGSTSSLWIEPERGCVVVLLSNSGNVKLEPLTHRLADDVCK